MEHLDHHLQLLMKQKLVHQGSWQFSRKIKSNGRNP